MNVITHHCGVCGKEMNIPIITEGCRIQFIVPPCKPCIDEAMDQGAAKAIVKQVTKGKDLE
jgi:hypothetical protein